LRRPLYVCLIDEFDSVCVDDARTPLVISQPQQAPSSKIATAMKIINLLLRKVHYEVDEKAQKVRLRDLLVKWIFTLTADQSHRNRV
jgi:preprotein translocase subunit SecA